MRTYAIAVAVGEEPGAELWLDQVEPTIHEALAHAPSAELAPQATNEDPPNGQVTFRVGRGREQYLADIARCQSALAAGESYEVCLTDQIHTDASPDPWELYRGLRRSNPAPFAAYLKLGENTIAELLPRAFPLGRPRPQGEARPIKGTAPRSEDPWRDAATRDELQDDEKTFAEHLMIVDLLRNDLGRVCEVDTRAGARTDGHRAVRHRPPDDLQQVRYPGAGGPPIDCVRACFPGGSMTGAPKLRTMEIIDDIEREARGVYSGAIGWFGLDGTVDLHRHPHDRAATRRDHDRRGGGDRDAVRPPGGVRGDPPEGTRPDGRHRTRRHRCGLARGLDGRARAQSELAGTTS